MNTERLKPCKGLYPFRLATTSYIYKDGWAGNVEKLAPCLDEIELVFFESRPDALPDTREIDRLYRLSGEHRCSFNVHMPIDLRLGSEDRSEREHALETIEYMTALTEMLNPSTYTIHLDFEEDLQDRKIVRSWQKRSRETLEGILSTGLPPERISIENLDYPFELVEDIIRDLGLRVCFDVGHMFLAGGDVLGAFDKYRDIIDIIHFYGIGEKGEHRSLEVMPIDLAQNVIRRLKSFAGTVSLEVFSYAHLTASLDHLEKLWMDVSGSLNK